MNRFSTNYKNLTEHGGIILMNNQIERRKHQRFKAIAGSVAVLKDDSNNLILGKIINLGRGGLALTCISFEEEDDNIDANKVDMFREYDEYYLTDLACVIVDFCKTAKEFPFSSLVFNKYSVQFVNLTPSQILHLNYLIDSSAKNPSEPRRIAS